MLSPLTGSRCAKLKRIVTIVRATTVNFEDVQWEVLGDGVTFKRATVEATTDSVTHGIEKQLPWLSGFKGVLGGRLEFDQTRPERI